MLKTIRKGNNLHGASAFCLYLKEYDLSSLRICVSGGAPLPLEISKTYEKMAITILEGNGPTETSPVAYVNPPGGNSRSNAWWMVPFSALSDQFELPL